MKKPLKTTIVNIHEAKTQFSRLLKRVAAGQEIIIARAGHPVVRLIPFGQPGTSARDGRWPGRDRHRFDAPLPGAVLANFER